MSPFYRLALAVCLALGAPASVGAQGISPSDAAAYVGQTATVTGAVSEVSYDERSGNTFINMGGRYPNQKFVAIIFPDDLGAFVGVVSLRGATVSFTGEVTDFRGKPQIVLTSPSQIAVH